MKLKKYLRRYFQVLNLLVANDFYLMKKNLLKFKNSFIVFLSVISLGIIILYSSQVYSAITKNGGLKFYSNANYGISFNYPENWVIQEGGHSELTPFSILLSDVDLKDHHFLPGEYPEKFINIVFYRTSQTEEEYAAEEYTIKDLNGKQVKNLVRKDSIIIDGRNSYKYKAEYTGGFKKGKYFSAYKRSGEYLIIIETYLQNLNNENEIDGVFFDIIQSLKISK